MGKRNRPARRSAAATPRANPDYFFRDTVSEPVLCRYLARAVHLCGQQGCAEYVPRFIANTGAKYICRAACCWRPDAADYATYDAQRKMIATVHKSDPDVVFEACIFECVSTEVEDIDVPARVFEAFGMPPETRKFSFRGMQFPQGCYVGQWGENTAVPDITRSETRLFFYHRACAYIDLGYEALHMGQVHLIGKRDEGWRCWTELLAMIRAYARAHARRGFVFINAHTHGILGADGRLLFDFHMYPARFVSDATQKPHFPTEGDPQRAYLENGHSDAIYGRSLGGRTYSGWVCASLPYLVEFDNFGDQPERLNRPEPDPYTCWGMDEITWFANQPASYRAEILRYAYYWMRYYARGVGFISMPGQRVARLYNEAGEVVSDAYYGYDPRYFAGGFGDEGTIRALWSGELRTERDDPMFRRDRETAEHAAE